MTTKKTILISGGAGMLAREIHQAADNFHVINPKKIEMDITYLSQVEYYIEKFNPDYFIHCGAYTRPMSKHQENPEVSIGTNIIGTANVSMACIRNNIKLIYS